jgi:Zn-dependent peptidase ImmA (M78 family)
VTAIAKASGIPADRLHGFEHGEVAPTGDEVLILADHFRKDFRFLLVDDAVDPDAGVEILFRQCGDELSVGDRLAIAEFVFLCRNEAFLESELGREKPEQPFIFTKRGTNRKRHGQECAAALRAHIGLSERHVIRDIYGTIRDLGIRVFRRRLENSRISGIFIRHPDAGRCILVNIAENMARQRFSAAHELGHALLDQEPVTISMIGEWPSNALVEIRANTFAADFLMPPGLLRSVTRDRWTDPAEVSTWAERLRVSVPALLSALYAAGLVDYEQRGSLRQNTPRPPEPPDPELEGELTAVQRTRKIALLDIGLSKRYVDLCFDGYLQGAISRGRLAEMLLANWAETVEIAELFGRRMGHA